MEGHDSYSSFIGCKQAAHNTYRSNTMSFITNNRFNFTAFAIAATAVVIVNGSMLVGFDRLASNGHPGIDASSQLAKANAAARTVTLDRVVISTRRV